MSQKGESDESMEMNDDDSFSNSPEGSSDDEDADEGHILALQQQVEASPYTYDLHVQIIALCRKAGDLEKLRAAREKMSKLFPLSPELWLDWLTDEKTLASTQEQKEELTALFERSLKDYSSVSIWLEYVQFSIGKIGDSWQSSGLDIVRGTFERALTSVGIHVAQGCLIWEAYREFEAVYLMHLKNQDADADEIKKQEDRIYTIFKRQLSIPLVDMERTYCEFQELYAKSSRPDKSSIEYSYQKGVKKLDQLQYFEESIDASESPHYEEYQKYIQFEKKEKEPIRIQNIYERALIENCLKDELWLEYSKYMDQVVKIKEMSLPVYERAVRNCPWCVVLWVRYGRAMERFEESHDKVIGVFETALEMGFTKAEDFKDLWLVYLDYMRRRLNPNLKADLVQGNKEFDEDIKEICSVFNRALTQMREYFYSSESEYAIVKYWIFINVAHMKDVESSRSLWENLISSGHKDEARVWLDYVNFERQYGDASHYRKALLKALSCVSDWQETFVDLLINFEREEGTLESLEKSLSRVETQMQIVKDKRQKKLDEATNNSDNKDRRVTSKHSLKGQPRSLNERSPKSNTRQPVQMDSEGFKIPPVPEEKISHSPDKNETQHSEHDRKRRSSGEENQPESKKRKTETSDSHGSSVKHDPSKDDRSVFLSNLSFKIDEVKIKEFFVEIGEIEEVRLVKDYKGRSKGFCFVVYKSELDAKSALSKDRALLDGRPVLVSRCEDKKSNLSMQAKFKFGTGLERNKLFIKNLPVSTSKEELQNMFSEFGKLKDVRLVTYRNGHSKGLAYVDFEDEVSAKNAVLKMDNSQVQDNVISVAISNPPPRRPKRDFSGVTVSESLGGGSTIKGPRGRGRTQLSLLPRSVVRPRMDQRRVAKVNKSLQNGQNSDSPASTEVKKSLSNSDFANMLKK